MSPVRSTDRQPDLEDQHELPLPNPAQPARPETYRPTRPSSPRRIRFHHSPASIPIIGMQALKRRAKLYSDLTAEPSPSSLVKTLDCNPFQQPLHLIPRVLELQG